MDEYCSSVRDGTHDTPKPTEFGYYLVTSKAINNNTIDFKECYYISEDDYIKINKRSQVDKWDVIMTMIGTVGRLHLVKDVPQYAIKNIALFKLGDEHRAKWLYYYLSTSTVQSYFDLVASGTSQHFIGLGNLRKFKVEEYRDNSKRITDILSTYDSLIELNTKRIKTLEQMAENLYKEWFVRFRFPRFEEAEFEGGIPKGWEIAKIGDIGEVIGGGTPSTDIDEYWDGEIPWLTPADLADFDGVYIAKGSKSITEFGLKKSSTRLMPKNTVLLSSRAPIGYVALARNEICTNQGFKSVVCDVKRVLYPYLFYFFKMNKPLLEGYGSGATFLELSGGTLKKIKLLLPPIKIQKAFAHIVDDCFDQIYVLYEKNNILKEQRDLLLPRLMSGKLEVK